MRRRLAARAKTADTEAPELEAQASRLRAEIERLGEAIVSTTDAPGALVLMMGEREKRLPAIDARIAAIRMASARRVHGAHDAEPRRSSHGARAQLGGPLRFAPVQEADGKRFKIEGEIALESVFLTEGADTCAARGEAGALPRASPTGRDPLVQLRTLWHFAASDPAAEGARVALKVVQSLLDGVTSTTRTRNSSPPSIFPIARDA